MKTDLYTCEKRLEKEMHEQRQTVSCEAIDLYV